MFLFMSDCFSPSALKILVVSKINSRPSLKKRACLSVFTRSSNALANVKEKRLQLFVLVAVVLRARLCQHDKVTDILL